MVLFALGTAASFVLYVWAVGETHGAMDAQQSIDDPETIDAIDRECAQLQGDLDAVTSTGPDRIREENEAVERFVERLRASTTAASRAADPPTDQWLQDWVDLSTIRGQHASGLDRDPTTAPPPLPQIDGVPITQRMDDAVTVCSVPSAVLDDFEG